ncbi:TRAP transporter small permease [Abyssibius alkaniclasticus]|uniref:TRAP transporter small permease n=1 Tax=Abyssibius alkaniclasticus TaxID=2881234 RepID=UPI004059A1E6
MAAEAASTGRFGRIINTLEETIIAYIMLAMVVITFGNVILRYVYNSGWIWGLELTVYLFAWLVLFGISYCVKVTAHLGVDAAINLLNPGLRRVSVLIATAFCIVYAALLMKGAWDYYAPFAGMDATTGRWFPTGFANSRDQGWYETSDIPLPAFLGFLEGWFNQGEAYEKLPRLVPYLMLPLGIALLLFRFVQAFILIALGRRDHLIASHEAEDAVEEAGRKMQEA